MSYGSLFRDSPSRRGWPAVLCRTCGATAVLLLAACAAGPDYQRPAAPFAATDPAAVAFKEGGAWKPAQPGAVNAGDTWWKVYNDPLLDQLVAQANRANQTLAQAQAQYQQAAALVPAAQAANLPTLGVSASEGRGQSFSQGVTSLGNSHAWSFQAGWEPDFWGHVSRNVEAAGASAQASAGDFAAARLTVQATLVNDYLQLRLNDRQSDLYAQVIAAYTKSLQITQSQLRHGTAAASDVELASATLSSTQAQAADLRLTRAQLEHAIAVLTGQLPAAFSIAAVPADAALPVQPDVPALLPSALLERRPDIAAAERRVAAANANIGVVQSAWYPNLTLAASYGNAGPSLADWFLTPYQAWAVGGTLAATLFDGGVRDAQTSQARAGFDAAAAAYRQTVLNGFQEVEDNLAAMAELRHEIEFEDAAVRSSRSSENALLSQYRAGTAPYTAVVTVQATALANERAALQLRARLQASAVALIKATGGGWQAASGTAAPAATPPATPPAAPNQTGPAATHAPS